jgi:hypothetical protein
MVGCMITWIEAVLANDETSTDAELRALFINEGAPPAEADKYVAKRTSYLKARC